MSHVPVLLMWGFPGGPEWIIILIVVLIFFGNRIPGMARALGSGINEFKSGLREGQDDAGDSAGDTAGPKVEDGKGDKDT